MQHNQQSTNRVPATATRPISEGPRAPISQPSLMTLADAALKWAGELENNLDAIQAKLFGPTPSPATSGAPLSLEEKVAALSVRLALLCGFTATLLQRLDTE